jgi:hypothetical protein
MAKEMRAVTVCNIFRTEKPNAEFVDERAWFKRVVKPFAVKKSSGDPPQLRIHDAEQPLTSILDRRRASLSATR